MSPTLYLLDSNVFIEAARRYYAFDIVPGFWTTLVEQMKASRVASIEAVFKELEKGKDKVTDWATTEFREGFKDHLTPDTIEAYQNLQKWAAKEQRYSSAAKAEFADFNVADAWLIAHAQANNATIVTHEEYNVHITKKIPIPNVCKVHHVRHCNTFDMLRELGLKLSN